MNILGISAFYHDSAAALVRDGEPILDEEQEPIIAAIHVDTAVPAPA